MIQLLMDCEVSEMNGKYLAHLQGVEYERYTKIICPICRNPMFVGKGQGECYTCGKILSIEELTVLVEEEWLEGKEKPYYNKGVGYN